MRIAAIDLGSNSFHMVIVETRAGNIEMRRSMCARNPG